MVSNKKFIIFFSVLTVCIISLTLFTLYICFNYSEKDYADTVNSDMNNEIIYIPSHSSMEEIKVMKNATIPIFTFHAIGNDFRGSRLTDLFVKPSDFESYVKYIAENGYDSIFTSEIDNVAKYEKPVCLNFDDGYVDFYTNAYPILEKYKVKGTVYVIINLIGTYGYCTWEQLIEMSKSPYVSVQSHTMDHPTLASLSKDKQEQQLKNSKDIIQEKLGNNVDSICYPIGSYNDTTIDISKKYYTYGIANYHGIYKTDEYDKFKIPRVYIPRNAKFEKFENACKKSNIVR